MFVLSLVYLVLTIIRPQDYMPGLVGVPILPVVLIVAFALWLGSTGKNLSAPQFVILPVFLLVMLLSDVANGWLGGALEQLEKFGPTVIAFFVLATAVSASRKRVVVTFAVFTLCAMVLALHGVDQFNSGIGWTGMGLSEDRRIQYVGIFNDPNDLGLLFVATWPMALYLSSRGGFVGRVFWLAGAALLLYGIYLTNSRGAFLAIMVIVAVYLWRKRGLLTSLALSGIGMMGLLLIPTRVQEISVDEDSAFGRIDAWYEGLHMFLSHPLLGVGAGNFTDFNDLTAHNSFVLVIAETGFLGYVLWLSFVGYSFLMTLQILRHQIEVAAQATELQIGADWERERSIALTMLLSLCGMFAAAFFLSRSYTVVMYLLIALVVGNFVRIRAGVPGIRGFSLMSGGWWWVPAALGSIAFLGITVIVLMHSA